MKLATVINGKFKGETVAPYCKLRFGWLCDRGEDESPAVIEEEYLRWWKECLYINEVTLLDIVNTEAIEKEKNAQRNIAITKTNKIPTQTIHNKDGLIFIKTIVYA